jgi:hypothetical protein
LEPGTVVSVVYHDDFTQRTRRLKRVVFEGEEGQFLIFRLPKGDLLHFHRDIIRRIEPFKLKGRAGT